MAASHAWPETRIGEVVGMADADTVTELTNEHRQVKIRIAGAVEPVHASCR